MDFEELQVIWNSQNNEKMYAINENTLHAYIKQKSRSINKLLNFFEYMLIGMNLAVGIWLTIESLDNNPLSNQFILAVFYLAFGVYALIRRLMRRNEEKPFDPTMVGELDKAIWRIEYLMKQSLHVITWYLLPLVLIIGVMAFFDTRLLLTFIMLTVVTAASYFGHRWEFNKFHLPNQRNLEALREKLTTRENQ